MVIHFGEKLPPSFWPNSASGSLEEFLHLAKAWDMGFSSCGYWFKPPCAGKGIGKVF